MKHTSVKRIILFSLIIITFLCNAQNKPRYNGLFTFKNSGYSNLNLKDSVKSVYLYYTKIKESLTEREKLDVIMKNDLDNSSEYVELNKYGLQTILRQGKAYKRTEFDQYMATDKFEYNTEDIVSKKKYKIEFEQIFPVMNRNLLIKANEDRFYCGSYTDLHLRRVIQTIYKYKYNKLGRVIEELEYNTYADDSIPVKIIKKEDLYTRKTFVYNNKNQVILQKITAGDRGISIGNYTDFGTESAFCDDLQLKYAYDPKGRIIQVIMYGCEELLAQEDYKYDEQKNYVTEAKRFRGGMGSDYYPNTTSFYNELGDIVKKELIPDKIYGNKLKTKYRYYDYDYDKHNNWVRCRMYLEGTHEGEPSIIFEREIEYYNEVRK